MPMGRRVRSAPLDARDTRHDETGNMAPMVVTMTQIKFDEIVKG